MFCTIVSVKSHRRVSASSRIFLNCGNMIGEHHDRSTSASTMISLSQSFTGCTYTLIQVSFCACHLSTLFLEGWIWPQNGPVKTQPGQAGTKLTNAEVGLRPVGAIGAYAPEGMWNAEVSFSIRPAVFLAGDGAENWNHMSVDWNKSGIKFGEHVTGNFHQSRVHRSYNVIVGIIFALSK